MLRKWKLALQNLQWLLATTSSSSNTANNSQPWRIDELVMYEIKDKFRAFAVSPHRWLWLTALIAMLLAASVALGWIISMVNDAWLAKAVRDGNSDVVKTLLDRGVNPNGIISQDVTYLDYAAQVGDVRLANILLDRGVDPNVTAISKNSPLIRAIEGNQQGMAQLLLKYGAKIPEPTSDAPNLLHRAVEHGDSVTVQLLLERGADVEAPFPNGMRPIEWAVRNASVELVDILIQHGGADPNLVTREGQSLLALAVALDIPEVVAALVDHGADINSTVTTPVSESFIDLFKTQYARFYLTKDSGLTPLMLAILRKRQDTVRTLLARKASLNTPTKKHKIWPIGLAAGKKDVEMMQVLLGRDPDPAKQERHIRVSLRKQTATLYVNNNVALKTRVSTGRKGYATPPGKYVITNKYQNWISSIYKVPMPYFMRLNASDIGLHQGIVPRRPASHGCIRVPKGTVARLFASLKVGDLVTIEEQ